jgi:hypothetical protein
MRVWETSIRVSLAHESIAASIGEGDPDTARPGRGTLVMPPESHLLRDLTVFMFALTAGLTLSGITANIYRIFARKPQGSGETILYWCVMVIAGASVLLENATRTYRKRDCSAPAYGFAVALVGYWCFIMGLFILSLTLAL